MKKLLIATAALAMVAGTAQAQSSVTVYGVVDVGYGETKNTVSGSGTASSNGVRQNTTTGNGDGGLATSRLGFRGVEDLGGGNKANFVLEYDLLDAGAGTTLTGARESWVGLESAKMGQIRLGRQATGTHAVVAGFSAGFANNTVGAIYSNGGSASTTVLAQEGSIRPHNVYANRLITYISPVMGGVVVSAQYGKDTADTRSTTDVDAKTEFTDLAVRYNAGKLALGAGYQKQKTTGNAFTSTQIDTAQNTPFNSPASANFATNADTAVNTGAGTLQYKTIAFGASYDFGIVQPFVLHTQKKDQANTATAGNGTNSTGVSYGSADDRKTKATEIGLRAPIAARTTAFASMYDGDLKFSDSANKGDLSGYQLGLIYDLSKRTAVYAITGEQKIKITNTAYNNKTTGTSVGVRHSF